MKNYYQSIIKSYSVQTDNFGISTEIKTVKFFVDLIRSHNNYNVNFAIGNVYLNN